jgi:hypothetical protein
LYFYQQYTSFLFHRVLVSTFMGVGEGAQ